MGRQGAYSGQNPCESRTSVLHFAAKWNAFCRKMECVLPQNGKRFAAKWKMFGPKWSAFWPKMERVLAQNERRFGPKWKTFWPKMDVRFCRMEKKMYLCTLFNRTLNEMNNRPLILISNDDGYEAKGIRCLVDMVRHLGDVIVCAPEGPRSGFSCAFSATTPLTLTLRHKEEGVEIWSSNGTPVDCVKLALHKLAERTPDMVLGGINHGDNGSVNTHYSGTMGVVMEGCMKYIPSIAYSLCDHHADADFEPMRPYIDRFTRKVLSEGLPKGVCLNINFPLIGDGNGVVNPTDSSCGELKAYRGVKVCRMAQGSWCNEITTCHHPRGYDYYWMVGHYRNDEPLAEDTDNWALQHGYIAITPTMADVTAYETMKELKSMEA